MGATRDNFIKYPRTPHLFGSKGTDDDKHLGQRESEAFIADPSLIVEEKIRKLAGHVRQSTPWSARAQAYGFTNDQARFLFYRDQLSSLHYASHEHSTMTIDPRLHRIVAAQPYPLLFATISGAHLYGFPSPDSDFDLRGAHVLPLPNILGLQVRNETVEDSRVVEGLEMDIVSHDVRKFFRLLLKKNGYVLEQLFSPLIVHRTPEHAELKEICRTKAPGAVVGSPGGVMTRHHSHHYFGFAETQWKLFLKESPCRVKPLLYVYRVLLTGIHLMRTGDVEANLVTLNGEFRLPYIGDLVARKLAGPEQSKLEDADVAFHEKEYERLRSELERAHEASRLPEVPDEWTRAALNDLLVRVRMKAEVHLTTSSPPAQTPRIPGERATDLLSTD